MWKLFLILIPLSLHLFVGMYFSVQAALYLFAGLFFLLPTVMLFKEDVYEKYWSLVNPWMQKNLEQKDETFRRKNKRMNILSWYLLAILFFFQGSMARADEKLFAGMSPETLLQVMVGLLVLLLVAGVANHLIIKKSRTNGDVIFWSILVGVGLFGMMAIMVSRLII